MENLSIMTVLQSQADLSEPAEHVILWEVLQHSSLLPFLMLFLNSALQVSSICKIHDNAQLALLCLVDFSEPHDVGMVEHL